LSVKDTINSINFFSKITQQQLEFLVSISTIQNYTKNYILHYEQKYSNKLLFLKKGLAKAYKIDKHDNEIFLYYIYENTLISEVTDILSDELYSFSNIELVDDSQILSIDYKQFKKHFLEKNIFVLEFMNEIVQRGQKLQDLVNREFIFDSVSKVAMMLETDLEMFNKLKRHDISLILHIQPATLSRVLNRLKRNKIIDIIQGRVDILDSTALKKIYEE
jgi:CRP/FNR family transcriptional regulator